ncbi:MAG TPA: hypothetical protein VGH44_01105 [Candidatus Saccharimonadia bacterium]|jgi:hypothetical protein
MKSHLSKRSLEIARSLAIIGGTSAMVIGATFAATVGTASLTGNTFSVGSGGILIAPDNSGTPGTFVTSTQGFNFGSLTEGGTSAAHQHFWLKNATDATVTVNETAADVSAPNLDDSKVIIHIEKTGTNTDNSASLADLSSGSGVTLTNTPSTSGTEYDVWVTLDSSALSTATVANASFGLDFTGTTTGTVTPSPSISPSVSPSPSSTP